MLIISNDLDRPARMQPASGIQRFPPYVLLEFRSFFGPLHGSFFDAHLDIAN